MVPLSEIFPDQEYRFHLTLRKGDLAEFFGPTNPRVVAERRRWLECDPDRYAAGTEEAAPVLLEFENVVRETWGKTFSSVEHDGVSRRLVALGGELEPDFVLLSNDGGGTFRVRAGVVCFPSWWALTEKLGQTLDETHAVVPGLNSSLGPTLSHFLQKLKPGTAYERSNWGLAVTPELNLHPALNRPSLSLPVKIERIWVRIEDQILAALASTKGIVFGIRLRIFPLQQLLDERGLRAGFFQALRTMPDALARYKGLAPVRNELLKES